MTTPNSLPRQRERRRSKRNKTVSSSVAALGAAAYLGLQISRLFSPDVIPEDYVEPIDKPVVMQVNDEVTNEVLEDITYIEGETEDALPETISTYDEFERYFYRDGLWDADLLEKYFSLENLDSFKYLDEIGIIVYTAHRLDVDPALLLAIRQAEGGEAGKEFGILPEAMSEEMRQRYYDDRGIYEPNGAWREYIVRFPGDELEKQATWCAWTIRKNKERYRQAGGNPDNIEGFIDFLGDRYAPARAENDPHGLNQYWEGNVLRLLHQYSAVY
jgi:hypothetical protein